MWLSGLCKINWGWTQLFDMCFFPSLYRFYLSSGKCGLLLLCHRNRRKILVLCILNSTKGNLFLLFHVPRCRIQDWTRRLFFSGCRVNKRKKKWRRNGSLPNRRWNPSLHLKPIKKKAATYELGTSTDHFQMRKCANQDTVDYLTNHIIWSRVAKRLLPDFFYPSKFFFLFFSYFSCRNLLPHRK